MALQYWQKAALVMHPGKAPEFAALFEPIEVKGMTLPNRFVMPAMQRGWCEGGAVLPELADYYRKRVEGGISLVIGESAAVDHPSATMQPLAARLDDRTAASWERCVKAVKSAGGRMLLQLWHEGALRNDADGLTRSASGIAYPGLERGRGASRDELEEIKAAYVRSALIARAIGADGVELHAAHGYFLDQFLWPETNRRTDGYGAEAVEDRARYPAEIVSAIREACGADFVLSFRFSQWKEHAFDASIVSGPNELTRLLEVLKGTGVDLFHASTRRFWDRAWPDDPRTLAEWSHEVSGLPVIAVGSVGLDRDVMESFTSEREAESRLEESLSDLDSRIRQGRIQLISVGRSLISDPDFVAKVRKGDLSSIRTFRKKDIDYLEWEGLPE